MHLYIRIERNMRNKHLECPFHTLCIQEFIFIMYVLIRGKSTRIIFIINYIKPKLKYSFQYYVLIIFYYRWNIFIFF